MTAMPETTAHSTLTGVVISGIDVFGRGRHGFLHGNINVLTVSSGQTMENRYEDGNVSPIRRSLKSLVAPQLVRRGFRPSGNIHVATHSKAY